MKTLWVILCLLLGVVSPADAVSRGVAPDSPTKQARKQAAQAAQRKTAANKQPTMTHMVVHLEAPRLHLDALAAKPKVFYRAGERYCRIEEAEDPDNNVQRLVVINQRNVWMVNLASGKGRHMLDRGQKVGCHLPIFTLKEVKAPGDLNAPLAQLEFGRELEFFRKRAKPTKGPTVEGQATKMYALKIEDADVALYTNAEGAEHPLAVILRNNAGEQGYYYRTYERLPFDGKLFAKPENIQMREPKPPAKPTKKGAQVKSASRRTAKASKTSAAAKPQAERQAQRAIVPERSLLH